MNQDKVINDVMREINTLDDAAKLQMAEMVLRSLREKSAIQEKPQEKTASFADLQGIGRGLWDEEGGVDEFIRKMRGNTEN